MERLPVDREWLERRTSFVSELRKYQAPLLELSIDEIVERSRIVLVETVQSLVANCFERDAARTEAIFRVCSVLIEEFGVDTGWGYHCMCLDRLRALEKIESPPQPQRLNPRRDAVDAFIAIAYRDTGRKITRTDIWRSAGYSNRREFELWQAGKKKDSSAIDIAITSVLRGKTPLRDNCPTP